ncbi:uncharacterized protein BT62DRAFT_990816 [Guyanagaster necrorhizus]|uniref:Putative gamma-glutamylcyclotransferase n=1 Tax=Guyanagaster necrorhizus TaxID=856835 RepID=A0A9P7W0R8_9AGAR|nr:uncharacterized protein BT62DRAFT_990816 [Guyanagaster necrorhizus MCA 3950]KAG7451186.1 hypothetical protein BT62DRAFT_990816 [Guyanagaster necrorhizus MCA 3950]
MSHSAFFYGTLMHPKILTKVIKNDGSHLEICPAVLLEHTRHKVKSEEYPGVIPFSQGQTFFDRELTQEEKCVRGTLVHGLTNMDILLLDVFEGTEYTREPIPVHPLEDTINLSEYSVSNDDKYLVPNLPAPLPPIEELAEAIPAETYIYRDTNNLDAELWSFADFVRFNAWKWYQPEASEVDGRNGRYHGSANVVTETIAVKA